MFKPDRTFTSRCTAVLALLAEAGAHAARGGVPAAIGACGALGALVAAPLFLAPASVPMSLLGLTLGHRAANRGAVLVGAFGLLIAAAHFLRVHPL